MLLKVNPLAVFYDEICSLQWMTFFWLALFLVIFQPNSAAFCRAYPPSNFPFFSFSSALLSALLSFFLSQVKYNHGYVFL